MILTLLADLVTLADGGLMSTITDDTYEALPIDLFLAWTLKIVAPIFFVFFLANFIMV